MTANGSEAATPAAGSSSPVVAQIDTGGLLRMVGERVVEVQLLREELAARDAAVAVLTAENESLKADKAEKKAPADKP